ncbi:MAG TPA: type II toxin-antitoxin system HicA family toxin [Ktedonobacterales bacterium]|nr:type II toxin-antitoxin system HicA family toxin [Ktedonobacterales bacterium]
MAPLSPLTFREVKWKLEAAGFAEHSHKGSHVKFVKQTNDGIVTAIVPHHRKVAAGTQRSILRQAGISLDVWEDL